MLKICRCRYLNCSIFASYGSFRHAIGLINVFLQVNCSFQVHTTQDTTCRLILCNADNKSSGNKGTQHDPARLIVCEIFLRKELTLLSGDLE